MNHEINGSFSWSDNSSDNSADASLILGNGNKENTTNKENFETLKISFNTIGGNASASAFSIPMEVDKANINLTSWLSSLDNPNNHVISDFAENGLIPITNLILEYNLKERINWYIDKESYKASSFCEPQIMIAQATNNAPNHFYAFLINKYSQLLFLTEIEAALDSNYKEIIHNSLRTLKSIFNIKFQNLTNIGGLIPSVSSKLINKKRSNLPYQNIIDHKTAYKKFIQNNILYLIDETDKCGFSIPNNSTCLNEYGIADFTSKCAETNLRYRDLVEQKYLIYSL